MTKKVTTHVSEPLVSSFHNCLTQVSVCMAGSTNFKWKVVKTCNLSARLPKKTCIENCGYSEAGIWKSVTSNFSSLFESTHQNLASVSFLPFVLAPSEGIAYVALEWTSLAPLGSRSNKSISSQSAPLAKTTWKKGVLRFEYSVYRL